jgi:hypothetical protein
MEGRLDDAVRGLYNTKLSFVEHVKVVHEEPFLQNNFHIV